VDGSGGGVAAATARAGYLRDTVQPNGRLNAARFSLQNRF